MSSRYITPDAPCHHRLLIIFTGWSTDYSTFNSLLLDGWDILVIYDYTTPWQIEDLSLNRYEEIAVMGWSFGVILATQFLKTHSNKLPITCTIAINGTLSPIDNLSGIPNAIFEATRNSLTENSLIKFQRRMCGSSSAYNQWKSTTTASRSIQQLKAELDTVADMGNLNDFAKLWDHVIISDTDLIIPTENQKFAWTNHPGVIEIQGSHLPDFQMITDQLLLDKTGICSRFKKAVATYDANADVQARIARILADKTISYFRQSKETNILEIGCGTGLLTKAYLPHINYDNLSLWDLSYIAPSLPGAHKICDAETEITRTPNDYFDLIISASTIQWFRSPIRFIKHCCRALKPGGLLTMSTFGPNNFRELSQFNNSSSTLRYLSAQQWRDNLPEEIEIIEISEELHSVNFASPRQLLQHIRLTGVGTSGQRNSNKAINIRRSGLDTLTYHPIYLLLRRKK